MKYVSMAAILLSSGTLLAIVIMILLSHLSPMIIARGVFILPFVLLWGILEYRKSSVKEN